MKAISYNMGEWQVVSDHLTVEKKLPPLTYTVRFKEEKGFYLKEEPALNVSEKMYGHMVDNIQTMVDSFNESNRSMGCIFSGDKGLGKSMAMRYLAHKMNEMKLPIIIVDKYYAAIARFLMSITCDAVIIFDEFDKTFGPSIQEDGNYRYKEDAKFDKQNELLSLFDGLSSNKFFFVVTCNSLYKVSDFLLDRPGRFHYHIRFGYPTRAEVTEYLQDNLKPEYQSGITNIVNFCDANQVNYDGIRSICFELNLGRDFNTVIKILNIDQNKMLKFNITVKLSNKQEYQGTFTIGGTPVTHYRYRRSLDPAKFVRTFLDNTTTGKSIEVLIPVNGVEYDEKRASYVIKKVNTVAICDMYDVNGDIIDKEDDMKITKISLEMVKNSDR